MKNQVVRKSVLAVALGAVMFSSAGFAESFGEYDKNFRSNLPVVSDALKKATAPVTPETAAETKEQLEARMAEIQQLLLDKGLLNEKRQDLKAEEAKLRSVIDKTQSLASVPALFDARLADEAKKRTLEIKDAEALAATLDTTPAFINPQTFSSSDLQKVCKKGADFSPMLGVMQGMGQNEIESMKQISLALLDKAKDKAIGVEKQKVADFIKHRRELLASNEKADGAKLKPEEVASIKNLEDLEKRLADIKNVRNPKWEQKRKGAEDQAIAAFESFADNLFKLDENDRARQALVAKFENDILAKQQQLVQLASKPATALFENCEKVRKAVFTDIDNTMAIMQQTYGLNSAANEAAFKEQVVAQKGITRNGTCTDNTSTITGIVGGFDGNLQAALDNMKAQQSIEGVFAASVQVMDQIRNMQIQLDPLITDMKEECNTEAETLAQIKNRSQQVVGAVGGGAVAGATGGTAFRGAAQGTHQLAGTR